MKKIKFTLIILFFTTSLQAQFYFNVFTGYSFSANPQKIENIEMRDNSVDSYHTKFQYGKGVNLGLGIGYNFKNGLGVELSSNTQIFTRSDYKNHWVRPSSYEGNYYVSGLRGEGGKENKSIQLAPLLVYSLDMGRILPYLKVGLNFLKLKTVSDQTYTGRYPDFTTERLYETQSTWSGKWRTGFRGAFGAAYKVSDNWNIYAEFLTVNTNYKFDKSVIDTYKVDGEDELDTIENASQDVDFKIDYSHVGVNFGIKYVFN